MEKELLKKYAEKLKLVSDDAEFIKNQLMLTGSREEACHMIAYLEENKECGQSDVIIEQFYYHIRRKKNQAVSAVMGLVVGDALGVPVEFVSRQELIINPVVGMRAYGTHNQPAGSWSDDSSMVIATLEWLSELEEFPTKENGAYNRLMNKFTSWLMYGDYTPHGENFDCGITVNRALMNYGRGMEPTSCGGMGEFDNGNGSLMRILPISLWCCEGFAYKANDEYEFIRFLFDMSALTHGHVRSKVACYIYSKIIADLMHLIDENKIDVVKKSIAWGKEALESLDDEEIKREITTYNRLWDVDTYIKIEEEKIKSSGYVVDTLEAAIWCFLNTDNFEDCVLKAVNLGDDTDTVGAVAGGLAGLYYGIDSIPTEWLDIIPKKDWIIDLTEKSIG